MKPLFSTKWLAALMVLLAACHKDVQQEQEPELKPRYSTLQGFRDSMNLVIQAINTHRVTAWLDTLPNGQPDVTGRSMPLAQWAQRIPAQLQAGDVQAAVYDVFHFDEATFSLISFLKKAEMTGGISPQTFADLMAMIPLPPVPAAGFAPPVAPPGVAVAACACDPEIRIKLTWAYRPACGNYTKDYTGYAANNTLTNMPGGIMYRFDPEVVNCNCGGTFSTSVTAPAGASYGYSKGTNGSVNFIGNTPGTYTITFTYTCPCGKVVTKSFTLTVK